MHLIAKRTVLLLALTIASAAGEARADNWARDHVRQHVAEVKARALGLPPSPSRPEIIGGTLAQPNRWPFQAAMLLAAIPDNYDAQFCGGTVIDEEFIITAAHCADFLPAAEIHVLTGTQSLKSGGTRREVKRIRIHPRYDNFTLDYDIALIQLKAKIIGLRPSEKALLITPSMARQLAEPRTRAFAVGWGATGLGPTGFLYPVALRQVAVPIVEQERCNAADSYDGEITRRMLCAGYRRGGFDSCFGDSGGPLLVANRAGRFVVLAGIVSWGYDCAAPYYYGVYTRVSVLEEWITANIAAMRTP